MANHLQRMALNANQKELSSPPTLPTHSDTIMYNNNNINNNNSNSSDYNNGNSNEVDIGDLSYLLNKIRPNLVGKDNRPHVNYRVGYEIYIVILLGFFSIFWIHLLIITW